MNLMGFISQLGASVWQKKFEGKAGFDWVVTLFKYLDPILYAIMAITAAAGMIYAIYLGINLARAEDQSKRDEAKKRLITTIISVAVVVVLIIFFNVLLPEIISAVAQPGDLPNANPSGSGSGSTGGTGSGSKGFIHL